MSNVGSSKKPLDSDKKLESDMKAGRKTRVLIVDDNQTNLDAAKGMMKPYGIKTDCVDSGQKAVAAITAGHFRYNAIFMDYMMPDMDGIETVRVIRNIGTEYALKVPIIALTANAAAVNEEMFLKYGFQAFLEKPIDILRLDEVMEKWVFDNELEAAPKERKLQKNNSTKDAVKLKNRKITGLDIEKGIKRYGGDEEAYLDVLRSFAANTRNILKSIENADERIPAEYGIIVHGIKGSSRGIFADEVGNAAEKLEKASKAGDFKYVSANNREFVESIRQLIHELEEMIKAVNSEDQKQMKDKPDAASLAGLLAACEAFEIEKVYEAMKDLERYEYKSGNELVSWLRENADLMNYTLIADRLLKLTPM